MQPYIIILLSIACKKALGKTMLLKILLRSSLPTSPGFVWQIRKITQHAIKKEQKKLESNLKYSSPKRSCILQMGQKKRVYLGNTGYNRTLHPNIQHPTPNISLFLSSTPECSSRPSPFKHHHFSDLSSFLFSTELLCVIFFFTIFTFIVAVNGGSSC